MVCLLGLYGECGAEIQLPLWFIGTAIILLIIFIIWVGTLDNRNKGGVKKK